MKISVYDIYDGDRDLLYLGESIKAAKSAIKERIDDTSGECLLDVAVWSTDSKTKQYVYNMLDSFAENYSEKVWGEL